MGRNDVSVKSWLKDHKRYADLFNGIIFEGRQVISANDLQTVDSQSNFLLQGKDNIVRSVERYRDIIMLWNNSVYFVLLATEIQDKVHYAMPVRKMLYDSLTYTEQMREIWQNLPEDSPEKKIGSKEFFSRFRKEDKLYPVITIVFYYGDEWDGSVDLYDMFGFDEEILSDENIDIMKKYISNYSINLFNPQKIEDASVFKTDLQIIFDMLKYKGDKKALVKYTQNNREYFSSVDYETAQAIKVLIGSGVRLEGKLESKEKEGNDVCKALEDLYDDGVAEGIVIGREEGREEGRILTYFEFGLSPEDIAIKVGKSVEFVNEVLGLQLA